MLLRRAVVGALILGGLVAVTLSDALHGALASAVGALAPLLTRQPMLGALLFIGLSAASAVLALFSSGAMVPVALDAWGPWVTGFLLWVGWMMGGGMAYGLGRAVGRPVLAWVDASGRAERVLDRIRPDTPLAVIALLQFALQSEISGAVLGASRYPFGRYLVALAVVEVIFAGLTVAAGAGLMEQNTGLLLAAGVALAAGAIGALAVVHRRLPPTALPHIEPDGDPPLA